MILFFFVELNKSPRWSERSTKVSAKMIRKSFVPIILLISTICTNNGWFLASAHETNTDKSIVHTTYGSVRGILQSSERKHVDFYAFRGIPYAKSPIGDLRFKVFMSFSAYYMIFEI